MDINAWYNSLNVDSDLKAYFTTFQHDTNYSLKFFDPGEDNLILRTAKLFAQVCHTHQGEVSNSRVYPVLSVDEFKDDRTVKFSSERIENELTKILKTNARYIVSNTKDENFVKLTTGNFDFDRRVYEYVTSNMNINTGLNKVKHSEINNLYFLSLRIPQLTAEELNESDLTSQECQFLTREQVAKLRRKGSIESLPGPLAPNVNRDLLCFLDEEDQVKCLNTKLLVDAYIKSLLKNKEEKILAGRQKGIDEQDLLDRVTSSFKRKIKLLQSYQIHHINDPEIISYFTTTQLNYMTTAQIQNIQDPTIIQRLPQGAVIRLQGSQLGMLTDDQLVYLTRKQLSELPENRHTEFTRQKLQRLGGPIPADEKVAKVTAPASGPAAQRILQVEQRAKEENVTSVPPAITQQESQSKQKEQPQRKTFTDAGVAFVSDAWKNPLFKFFSFISLFLVTGVAFLFGGLFRR